MTIEISHVAKLYSMIPSAGMMQLSDIDLSRGRVGHYLSLLLRTIIFVLHIPFDLNSIRFRLGARWFTVDEPPFPVYRLQVATIEPHRVIVQRSILSLHQHRNWRHPHFQCNEIIANRIMTSPYDRNKVKIKRPLPTNTPVFNVYM